MNSQYSARVPLLLPIACEYSHIINGRSCFPDFAYAITAPIAGYIGQIMSVTPTPFRQSPLIAPS